MTEQRTTMTQDPAARQDIDADAGAEGSTPGAHPGEGSAAQPMDTRALRDAQQASAEGRPPIEAHPGTEPRMEPRHGMEPRQGVESRPGTESGSAIAMGPGTPPRPSMDARPATESRPPIHASSSMPPAPSSAARGPEQQATPRPGSMDATQQRPPIRAQGAATTRDIDAPLFASAAAVKLRERWIEIQTEFVDSPRDAVEKADGLVAETLQQLTETFARERDELEAGWSSRGDGQGDGEPSTEDLRQAIRRYRSFFNRLLSV